MKPTIIILLAIVAVIGLMWWGSKNAATGPSNENPVAQSSLVAPETIYDFGTISMAKGNVNHEFAISNPTGKDILVSDLTTSCMCTAAFIVMKDASKQGPFGMPGMGYVPKANLLIKAGETRNIDVVYDPAAHGPAGVGSIDRFVYLTDTNGKTLKLEIKAVVTP